MKPYYEDSSVQIFHGDCREVLPTLDACDLAIVDPPYGETALDWDYRANGWLSLATMAEQLPLQLRYEQRAACFYPAEPPPEFWTWCGFRANFTNHKWCAKHYRGELQADGTIQPCACECHRG